MTSYDRATKLMIAEGIWQVRQGRHRLCDDEVGFFTRRDAAEAFAQSHRMGSVERSGVDGFFGEHAHPDAGH